LQKWPCNPIDVLTGGSFIHHIKYFSDIISTAEKSELTSKEMADFKTVHQLVIELNKAAPALLLNVVPQLEEELKVQMLLKQCAGRRSSFSTFFDNSSTFI
jgi:sister-chromatid-cohesion protein PDS5